MASPKIDLECESSTQSFSMRSLPHDFSMPRTSSDTAASFLSVPSSCGRLSSTFVISSSSETPLRSAPHPRDALEPPNQDAEARPSIELVIDGISSLDTVAMTSLALTGSRQNSPGGLDSLSQSDWLPTSRFRRVCHRTLRNLSLHVPLRGIQIGRLLKSRAGLLEASNTAEDTYSLSHDVEELDVFISHNWSTPRKHKFMVLAFHFNLRAAALLTLMCAMVIAYLTAIGTLPSVKVESRHGRSRRRHVYCIVVCSCLFWIILLTWHEIGMRCGCPGPNAFLDKACIHQTNASLKRQGILSLAGFLRCSQSLVVLYSDTYLQKLWTVYEFASFLTLHPGRRMVVLPLMLPRLVMTVAFLMGFVYMPYKIARIAHLGNIHDHGLASIVYHGLLGALVVQIARMFRSWAREQARIELHAQVFSIATAMCANEEDRPIVQKNISAFMIDIGMVPRSCTQVETLLAFDHLVQREAPHALLSFLGRVGVPYRYVVVMFLVPSWEVFDKTAALAANKVSWRIVLIRLMSMLILQFAVWPLSIACMAALTKTRLDWTGCKEFGYMWVISLLVVGFCIGFPALQLRLELPIAADLRLLPLPIGLYVALIITTAWVYWPLPAQRRDKPLLGARSSEDSHASTSGSMIELGCIVQR